VTRAAYDWQIYDPQRTEKGGVRWHTVEGSSVLHHKGRYYQMFSGGNWRSPGYGVSYAVSDAILAPGEWTQVADGMDVLPILRSEGEVVGPGHNSVVLGPDNRQLFCVYHRWVADERVMAMDRLEWVGDRLTVLGPTTTEQPAPIRPSVSGFGSEWEYTNGGRRLALRYPDFLAEMYVRPDANPVLSLTGDGGPLLDLSVTGREISLTMPDGHSSVATLAPDVAAGSYQHLRWSLDGRSTSLSLPETGIHWDVALDRSPDSLVISAADLPTAFHGFALTYGWEDTFEAPVSAADQRWQQRPPSSSTVENGVLCWDTRGGDGLLQRGPSLPDYELVVNLRLDRAGPAGHYGFLPALAGDESGPLVTVEDRSGWALVARNHDRETSHPLPPQFTPSSFQQFRFWKQNGTLTIRWEKLVIAEITVPVGPSAVGIVARDSLVNLDMVRVTAIL
jgi:hypothetical protein